MVLKVDLLQGVQNLPNKRLTVSILISNVKNGRFRIYITLHANAYGTHATVIWYVVPLQTLQYFYSISKYLYCHS